jgi:hypothetical protein
MMNRFLPYWISHLGVGFLLATLFCCYATFATNDYRPIVTAGLALWLLGISCLGLSYWRRWMNRAFIIVLSVAATLLVGDEMLHRGFLVLEYLWP